MKNLAGLRQHTGGISLEGKGESAAVVTEEKHLHMVQRLWGVVFSPGETFRDILARPYWLAPGLVIIALSVITVVLILPQLQAYALWEMERAAPTLSPAERAAVEGVGMAVMAAFGAAIVPVFIWLVSSLVLKFFNMFVGNQTPFRRFFAVAVYAYVPVLLGGLVAAVMIMFTRVENLPYVTTSLAALFPGIEPGFTRGLLTSVDPFVFWAIALLGIGGAQAMQVNIRSIIVYLVFLWVLFAVAVAALGAAFAP
jgi:hypothetical protein